MSETLKSRRWPLIALLLLASVIPRPAQAWFGPDGKEGSNFAIDAMIAVPDLTGIEIRFVRFGLFEFGGSFGIFPINQIVQNLVKIPTVGVNLGDGNTYNLYPSSNYWINTLGASIRIFPFQHGLFFKLQFTSLNLGASFSADLKNETSSTNYGSVVNGTLGVTQMMLGLSVGYQWVWFQRMLFELSLGADYLLPPTSSFTASGDVAKIAALAPGGTAAFNSAVSQVGSAASSALQTYSGLLKVIPTAMIAIGVVF